MTSVKPIGRNLQRVWQAMLELKATMGGRKNRAEIKDAWAEHNCHRLITGLSLTCRYAACLHAELHAGFKIGSLILTAGIATARAVIRA